MDVHSLLMTQTFLCNMCFICFLFICVHACERALVGLVCHVNKFLDFTSTESDAVQQDLLWYFGNVKPSSTGSRKSALEEI